MAPAPANRSHSLPFTALYRLAIIPYSPGRLKIRSDLQSAIGLGKLLLQLDNSHTLRPFVVGRAMRLHAAVFIQRYHGRVAQAGVDQVAGAALVAERADKQVDMIGAIDREITFAINHYVAGQPGRIVRKRPVRPERVGSVTSPHSFTPISLRQIVTRSAQTISLSGTYLRISG